MKLSGKKEELTNKSIDVKKQYPKQYYVILLQYLFHRFILNVIFANILVSNH